ncbi:hypothetical protein GCM10012275_42920 [Longimycelium tulufanense]|uniref:Uncharacterized protein n=1 Tax=Longimycelium tulufanense TaxID=907463 RepID=A0A8J3CB17_9PSEU|nr:hypothetical protein [Longimycelium tulufanense]GGM67744.1 hypothetical protein GCM10012275_42920 [Longimycelium tulufanense]
MNRVDSLFEGSLVEDIPDVKSEYARKMPGDYDGDNQGDHCSA